MRASWGREAGRDALCVRPCVRFLSLETPPAMKKLILLVTHAAALAAGFALGIYTLPILVAPQARIRWTNSAGSKRFITT